MRRRAYLGAVGAGIAGLAGCTSGSPSDAASAATPQPGTEPPEATETPTATRTPDASEQRTTETAGDSPVRLLSIDAPDRVQLGSAIRYRFTVENTGEEAHTLEPTASTRPDGEPWSEHHAWDPVELDPGARQTLESGPLTHDYVADVELRLDGYEPTTTVEFTPRRRQFRQGHRDPRGREIRINAVEFRSSYVYTDDEGNSRRATPGANRQYALLAVEVINRTDDALDAPPRDSFTLLVDDATHHPIELPDDANYVGGELSWGSRASGQVAFKTDPGVSESDVLGAWRDTFDGGEVAVTWAPR